MGMHLTENTDLYPTPKDAKSLKTSGISKAFDDGLRKTFESALSPRKKRVYTWDQGKKLKARLDDLSKGQILELLDLV